MLASLPNDLLYALRGLARRPTFAAVVILTLAVGIGANVAVFSLYDRLMLQQLPVNDPASLVNFVGAGPKAGITMCNNQGTCDEIFSYPMFRDLEHADAPFAGIAASRIVPTNLSFNDHTESGTAVLVSGGYFSVLGVGPALGRMLDREDDSVAGEASTAVVSYEYWSTALGADPAVLGKTLLVNGDPLEIVGVAPRGFEGTTMGARPQVFIPLTFNWFRAPGFPPLDANRSFYWAYLFGRLKPGVSLAEAQAAINVAYHAIVNDVEAPTARVRPGEIEPFRAKTIELLPGAHGQSSTPRTASTPLAVFFAATATILLIACVNLANLMLARGAARIGEMAVRTSLGAAPRRLLGMLTAEALLLAGAAAVASLPIAYAVLQGVGVLAPPYLFGAANPSLNLRAILAAFAIAALSMVVFALVPMLRLAGTQPGAALQANGARSFGGKALSRFRFSLATLQIALSMVLLVLAGLFTQSLANIARVDLGLRTESVLMFGVAPGLNGYTPQKSEQLFEQLEQLLRAQPGIMSVTSSMIALLSGTTWAGGVNVEGYEPPANGATPTNMNYVGSDFLRTFDIPLLAGRGIDETDTADGPLVAIVNRSFAKKYGLGANPLGKHLDSGDGKLDIEIVGLFEDAAYNYVKAPFTAQFLLPRRQSLQSSAQGMNFYVRTAEKPEALIAAIPRIVAQIDPNLPATNVQTLASVVRKNVQTDWLLTAIAATLAAIATLLAAIGLYGVLSYTVAQRTREIGVRLALGAQPSRVLGMVLKQVGWMTAVGLPLGLAAALLLGRLATALLYGLAPTDPFAFAGAAVLLTAVVVAAGYWPARRASRVDPVIALRSE